MTDVEKILLELALVVMGSAALSWLAIVAKQPMIVAYVVCGAVCGPWGLKLIHTPEFIEAISGLGVVLLLFLAGIVLHPDRLMKLFKRTAWTTLANCVGSFGAAFLLTWLWGYRVTDAIYVGLACMFSSTILVVKLLPTTALHQERMGSLAIGVLILQDLIAVAVLVVMRAFGVTHALSWQLPLLAVKAVGLTVAALFFEQYVLRRMMRRIDHFDEGIYLLALGWCLGNAVLWKWLGLSHEVGAFVAGVALARSPISLFLSEGLKPLRDFFLVLFFFMLGAQLDFSLWRTLLFPALALAALVMIVKPVLFDLLFRWTGETKGLSAQLAVRLGQLSEFGLILAVLADGLKSMTHEAAQLVEFTIILTIVASSYIVVFKYPTPIGTRKQLHKD